MQPPTDSSQPYPAFGDTVRVRRAPETEAAGLAGLTGTVYGVTTPSVTGVTVVGGAPQDAAVNVWFDARGADAWLRPDLAEVVDHGAGAEVRIAGVPVRWVREPDGSWREPPAVEAPGGAPGAAPRGASWHRDLFARLDRWVRRA